jgi:hypothetical protein
MKGAFSIELIIAVVLVACFLKFQQYLRRRR